MALDAGASLSCSIAPWLSVRDGERAVAFYKTAFGATEVYRLEVPDGGVVVKLSISGAEFWVSGESSDHAKPEPCEPNRRRFGSNDLDGRQPGSSVRTGRGCWSIRGFPGRRRTRMEAGARGGSVRTSWGDRAPSRALDGPTTAALLRRLCGNRVQGPRGINQCGAGIHRNGHP